MNVRDRDEQGRPRSARPRDASGRPLPRGTEGVATVPEDVVRDPDLAVAEAQRLLDDGYPFHAHEVLESAWKAATDAGERAVWKGLAQLAVGLTHAQRGNATGAATLLRRGADGVEAHADDPPHRLDLAALAATATALAARIDRDGLEVLAPTDLQLRLRHPSS